MAINHIGLISLTNKISSSDLSLTAAALQKQINRDLGPTWNMQATINSFESLNSVPAGYWPITISDAEKINDANDEGYHWSDVTNQPFAIIKHDETWQLSCSHEMCEMLVDPYGNKTILSDSINESQGRVNYLVEVCDPCEDAAFAYLINGILVSDFYTPNYFDPMQNSSVRYSFCGSISQPKQVLKNGYLTWQDLITGRWYQANYFGSVLQTIDITDRMQIGGPIRSRVDRITKNPNRQKRFSAVFKKHIKRRKAFENSTKASQRKFIEEIQKFVKL